MTLKMGKRESERRNAPPFALRNKLRDAANFEMRQESQQNDTFKQHMICMQLRSL